MRKAFGMLSPTDIEDTIYYINQFNKALLQDRNISERFCLNGYINKR